MHTFRILRPTHAAYTDNSNFECAPIGFFFGPVPATPKTGARIMGEISQTLKASAHDAHYFAIIPGYRGTRTCLLPLPMPPVLLHIRLGSHKIDAVPCRCARLLTLEMIMLCLRQASTHACERTRPARVRAPAKAQEAYALAVLVEHTCT